MNYTSIADMANTIRRNAWKVPYDISLIVGIPRSGMMAAIMLGEQLHKPVQTLAEFLEPLPLRMGGRSKHMRDLRGKVLVLDDTCYTGRTMEGIKEEIKRTARWNIDVACDNILYGCIYAEGRSAKDYVDIWLEDNYNAHEELWHLYEWNILHHGKRLSEVCMFDMDGILCKEPPDERNQRDYERYIADAIPMVLPTTKIGAIVTFRMEKYRKVTEEWLHRYGIENKHLIMASEEWQRTNAVAASFKAREYRLATWAKLFVESSAKQAHEIALLTGKQVYCFENGIMY